jgi:antagonist of KipI
LCAPVKIDAGSVLRLGRARRGWRACLAVRGGFVAEERFGSRSTDLRGGFGGYGGRALRRGDILGLDAASTRATLRRRIATTLAHPAWQHDAPLGLVVEGAGLDSGLQSGLLRTAFTVSTRADRMGLRLDPPLAAAAGLAQQVSAAVAYGAVQLPPDGHAIILGADRQTTGGYPLAGVVAGVDHWRIAQARPGDVLRMRAVQVDDALRAWRVRERELARLGIAAAAAWQDD